MEVLSFIADVHLGKLARALRLLGFDTCYSNAATATQLLEIASQESRILLSRSHKFSKHPFVRAFTVQSEAFEVQLLEVLQHFNLSELICPFSRCLVCNTLLKPVAKDEIRLQLQQNTAAYYNEFWQCGGCRRIYWKGSHYERMLRLVESVK